MKLHQLPKSHKKTQRIGRGGKRGTTAGRGTKGQRSRAGRRMRPAERDLILRIPKMRGFRNKIKTDKVKAFNLGVISEKLKSYAKSGAPLEIDIALLKTAGLLGKNFKGEVKILATGEVAIPVAIKGIKVSEGAKAKIEKAGGRLVTGG
jgi:large subunit ribosomal protein L15